MSPANIKFKTTDSFIYIVQHEEIWWVNMSMDSISRAYLRVTWVQQLTSHLRQIKAAKEILSV